MDESDPEKKTFPPAEDSGGVSSSERQQQKFQLTPEQRRFLGTRRPLVDRWSAGCSDPSVNQQITNNFFLRTPVHKGGEIRF
jgi:hypothetical protein